GFREANHGSKFNTGLGGSSVSSRVHVSGRRFLRRKRPAGRSFFGRLWGVGRAFYQVQTPGTGGGIAVRRIFLQERGRVLAGVVTVVLGFRVAVGSLGMASTTAGRMGMVLIGIAISLFGIMGVLNQHYLKNAPWKK